MSALLDDPAGLTPAQIMSRTDLAQAAVSRSLTALEHGGDVERRETTAPPGGVGRPRSVSAISDHYLDVIGVHIVDAYRGPTRIVAVSADAYGKTRHHVTAELSGDDRESVDAVLAELFALVESLDEKDNGEPRLRRGLAVAVGGHVEDGVVVKSDNVGWHNVDLQNQIEGRYPNRRILVANDASVLAAASNPIGPWGDAHEIVLMINREGVGGGLVFDGASWSGAAEAAGEFGHTIVPTSCPCVWPEIDQSCRFFNPRCNHHGCLEGVVTPVSIARAAGTPSFTDVIADVSNRRAGVESAVRWAGISFGFAIANIVNSFDPAGILVVAVRDLVDESERLGSLFVTGAREAAEQHVFRQGWSFDSCVGWSPRKSSDIETGVAEAAAVVLARILVQEGSSSAAAGNHREQ